MLKKFLIVLALLIIPSTTYSYDVIGLTDVNPEKNAYIHNNYGLMYLDMGQYYAAIQEFKIAISLNPNTQASSVYYNNLGETYLKLGYYSMSLDCFERAINKNPLNFKYYLNLVTSYQYMGILDKKLNTLTKNKQTPLDDITIGLIYIAKGQKQKGIAMLDSFVMKEPKLYITDGVKYYLQQFTDLQKK